MRLIPPEISARQPSPAEKRLHRLLREVHLPDHMALHSLNLAEHEYKRCGEIDFVVLGPTGLLVLEVKGGRVACRDGIWVFTDRYGKEHRRDEGPFAQARSAAFSLQKRLTSMLPASAMRHVGLGWGVMIPDQPFTETSVEWSSEEVLDEQRCATPIALQRSLERLIRYWQAKDPQKRRLTDAEVAALRDALRPDFDRVPSLRHRAAEVDSQLSELTGSQYRLLDAVDRNERLLCEGGAGTGKTLLAAEVGRRELAAGRSVLITCRSEVLARFIADQPGLDTHTCTVAPFDRLPAPPDDGWQTLVVDEAQDVMNLDDLARLDAVVARGLTGGRWRFFLDLNNQSGVLGRFDPEAVAMVDECGPSRVDLTDNCRNTRDIVTQVRLVTGADVGVTEAGAGVPVLYRYWDHQEDQASELATHLERLLEEGEEPRHISILGTTPLEESCIPALPAGLRARIVTVDGPSVLTPPKNRIAYSQIRDFKGLENRYICIIGLRTLTETEEVRKELYVGMTRARASLWIGLHRQLRTQMRKLAPAPKQAAA